MVRPERASPTLLGGDGEDIMPLTHALARVGAQSRLSREKFELGDDELALSAGAVSISIFVARPGCEGTRLVRETVGAT